MENPGPRGRPKGYGSYGPQGPAVLSNEPQVRVRFPSRGGPPGAAGTENSLSIGRQPSALSVGPGGLREEGDRSACGGGSIC